MLAFIYIAYPMMALLCDAVSTYEDIGCLGDPGEYCMVIEDEGPRRDNMAYAASSAPYSVDALRSAVVNSQ